MRSLPDSACVPASVGKPAARDRPLVDRRRAAALGRLFKVFANDTRLRLLHALERSGEVCVSDLAAAVEMAPQAVSNQLQRLADRRIVSARREGTRLYYSIADPCVAGFLDLGLCLLEETRAEPVRRRRAAPRGGRP
jgi:DNA-binding transcriptional ArsR family regulator